MNEAQIRYGRPQGIFSQLDEDMVLRKYFEGFSAGRFLDIGAYDGALYSNTRLFAMQGWAGLCVEASGPCFAELISLYPPVETQNVICLHAALTVDLDGEIEIHQTSDPVSTTEEFNRDKFSSLSQFERTKVPAISMSTLAADYPGPYDLISIDTEGTSVDLAIALPAEICTPGSVVLVEYDLDLDRLSEGMVKKGFTLIHDNGLNAIYAKNP